MTQQTSDWAKLDVELTDALKQLIRTHRIPVDPKDADYDTLWKGLEGPHSGLSGEEAYRYTSIGEDSFHIHNELTRLKNGGAWAGPPGYVEAEARKLIEKTLRLSQEEAPIQQPSEPISRLVMYLLPLFASITGLAVVVYFPNSEAAALAGVGATDLGFLGWIWAWRARFEKYPGPRQVWTYAAAYMAGLTVAVVLKIVGIVRPPGS